MSQDNLEKIQRQSAPDNVTTGITPENSLPAFDQPLDESAAIEIQNPKDGQLVYEQETSKHASNQYDIVNPYTNSNIKIKSFLTHTQAARLPDGKQAIPLGSGIITGLLGEGGMARVYKIWNNKLELYRAVKVIYPTESPELMERFETEIKISSKLHHPNIVETYVVGDWNGLPYIEMELVDGISLETLIQSYKNIPPVVSIAIGIQVASALAYAHTEEFLIYGRTYKGIIHRDLKPGNIMIGKNGTVKLMDFGIARPSEVHLHTVSGYIVGTLPYLSPEQLAEAEIDHRSDIYSLGTILYEAITGEKTFPQQTITNLMRMKVLHSYRKINSFPVKVTPEFIKVIEKCLRYDKKKRFETSKELVETLKCIIDDISAETAASVLKQYIDDPEHFDFQPIDVVTHKNPFRILFIPFALIFFSLVWFIISLIPPKKLSPDKWTGSTQVVTNNNSDSSSLFNAETSFQTINSTDNASQLNLTKDNYHHSTSKSPKSNVRILPSTKRSTGKSRIKERSVASTSIEDLLKKYGKTDIVEGADAASKSGEWNNVITLIQNMPSGNFQSTKGLILLALAYVELGRVSDAAELLESFSSDDAFYVLLEGRVAFQRGHDKLALNKFEEAMTRPATVRNTQQVRNEALYFSAITYDNRFNATRSPESRQQAMIAWNALKKAYLSHPEHSRFKLANEKLSTF
jgi:serine/threonine protein kinase